MSKIVLYFPWTGYVQNQNSEHRVPYSLLTLVGPLKNAGYDVVLIDGRVDDKKRLFEEVRGALFVGITSMTGIQLVDASKTARNLKKMYPKLPIVWGGWHVTILPEQSIREPFIDHIVVGQGERQVVEIAKSIENGQSGKITLVRDLEPFYPDIDFTSVDLNKYKPYFGYLSSHGCPFNCTFCAIAKVYNRKFFVRPMDDVISDLKYVFDTYKCFTHLNIDDDNFFIKKSRVEEFCDRWNNYANVPISSLAHVRALLSPLYDAPMWTKMVSAGIRILLIGAESGNQKVLDRLKKHQTPEQMLRFVKKTAEYGIQPDLSCLTGFPDSDALGDFKDTILFLRDAGRINPSMKFKIFFIRPYPGTELYEGFVRQGIKMPQSMQEWSHYTLREKPDWVSQDLYDQVQFFIYQWVPQAGWNWEWENFIDIFKKVKEEGKLVKETVLI